MSVCINNCNVQRYFIYLRNPRIIISCKQGFYVGEYSLVHDPATARKYYHLGTCHCGRDSYSLASRTYSRLEGVAYETKRNHPAQYHAFDVQNPIYSLRLNMSINAVHSLGRLPIETVITRALIVNVRMRAYSELLRWIRARKYRELTRVCDHVHHRPAVWRGARAATSRPTSVVLTGMSCTSIMNFRLMWRGWPAD